MNEFERRGLSEFSNKDLVAALNAIGAAWTRFNAPPHHDKRRPEDYDDGKNPLRTVILQTVNNQTINSPGEIKDAVVAEVIEKEEVVEDKQGTEEDPF